MTPEDIEQALTSAEAEGAGALKRALKAEAELDDVRMQRDHALEAQRSWANHSGRLGFRLSIAIDALEDVVSWRMPYKNYARDQGSNGERDFTISKAREALAKINGAQQ